MWLILVIDFKNEQYVQYLNIVGKILETIEEAEGAFDVYVHVSDKFSRLFRATGPLYSYRFSGEA